MFFGGGFALFYLTGSYARIIPGIFYVYLKYFRKTYNKYLFERTIKMWVLYALLSAVFAALVSILAKKGLDGINSNLATAIRTAVVLLVAWGIVFFTGKHKEISDLTGKNWRYLIYSGLATGASWLCYYRALQLGEVSKVAPIDKLSVVFTMILAFIFLKEPVTVKTIIGGLLITAGTLVLVF